VYLPFELPPVGEPDLSIPFLWSARLSRTVMFSYLLLPPGFAGVAAGCETLKIISTLRALTNITVSVRALAPH
jgi:hypothetical protein